MTCVAPQSKISRRLAEWQYQLFGPTILHLQFELYLLCSLTLFATGSLIGLYKESFGMHDVKFLLLLLLASSRHVLFRLWCTWDPSTHASPGFMGIISHFLQSNIGGGQTFDRTPPIQQLYPASTSYANVSTNFPSAADRLLQITGGGRFSDTKFLTSFADLLPDTLVYVWQFPRRYILYPIKNFMARRSGFASRTSSRAPPKSNSDSANERDTVPPLASPVSQIYQKVWQILVHLWLMLPTLQSLLVTGACCFYIDKFYHYSTGQSLVSILMRAWGLQKHLLIVHPVDHQYIPNRAGRYDRLLEPSTSQLFTAMLSFGTILSCLVFSRVITPIPDFVAGGGNVAVNLRTDVRSSPGQQNSSHIRRGFFGQTVCHLRDWFGFIMFQPPSVASDAAGWSEHQRSIAAENRLLLTTHVAFVRILENVLLFGILPRTHYTCRALHHCKVGPPAWELSRIIFPGGFSEPQRTDGFAYYLHMEFDRASFLWSIVGVAVVSCTLLFVQSVILNRSYFSELAYVARGWEHERNFSGGTSTSQSPTWDPNRKYPIWDPSRKYKQDDLVKFPDANGAIFRALLNNPEVGPCYNNEVSKVDLFLEAELGHPMSSHALGKSASTLHDIILVHFVVWIWRLFWHQSTYGLVWCLFAYAVAATGVLSVVSNGLGSSQQSSSRMKKLKLLSKEISAKKTPP